MAYGKLFDALTADGYDVRAAVLTSAFPKYFTAGLDCECTVVRLRYLRSLIFLVHDASALGSSGADTSLDAARASHSTRKHLLAFQHAIGAPERAPFPVIAAIHGHCIGLGVDMIGVCDIRYAAKDTKFTIKVCQRYLYMARIAYMYLARQEVDIGLAPDIGSLAFLPKITGNHSLVRELTYTARGFSADEAREFGLVSRVVEGGRDEVVREALALATFVAGKSPVAVSSAKHLITHSRDHR